MDPMDIELDAQIDLELQDDPVIKAMQLELDSKQPEEQKQPEKPTSGEQKMAEIEFEGLPRPNAIFLKGVDDMSTSDIKNYCGSADLVKVQWIDDTSCNLVFDTKEQAEEAIKTLLTDPNAQVNHTTLVASKIFENADGKNIELSLRVATDEDVKSKGSRERSRYYLLHGTEDSEVQREERYKDLEERMKRNGGDGRDVFSRLGNKVGNNERRGTQRRQRDRSASPSREIIRKTRELPDRLKNRLGALNNDDQKETDTNGDGNENTNAEVENSNSNE